MFAPRRLLFAAALALGLAACATPTPYQVSTNGGYGFTEQQIEPDRLRITFRGNSITDRETVETYLLFRAAEATLERGYDHFVLATRDTEADTRLQGFGSSFHRGFSPSYWFYGPRFGWRPYYDPFWDDFTVREITRYEAVAELVFGRGPKPEGDANAFDARAVIAELGDDVQRPTPAP